MSCYNCSADNDCISCDNCSRSICTRCSGLSASELKCIPLKKRILKFFCEDCRDGLSQVPLLRKEVIELKDKIDAFISSPYIKNNENIIGESCSMEQIMNEIHERNIRKNNLIVFGMQDPNDKSLDKNMVYDLFDQIQFVDKEKTKMFRIGKADPSNVKIRPLKLIFEDEIAMKSMLTKVKMLKGIERYKDVHISPDRTPMQMEYYKKIKSQLLERKSKGENDIRIRHVHGIPKIVKFNVNLN